jgi:hypothetical protein
MIPAFHDHQFILENSSAVRTAANMALPNPAKLVVKMADDGVTAVSQEKSLGELPELLRALDPYFVGGRPAFEET